MPSYTRYKVRGGWVPFPTQVHRHLERCHPGAGAVVEARLTRKQTKQNRVSSGWVQGSGVRLAGALGPPSSAVVRTPTDWFERRDATHTKGGIPAHSAARARLSATPSFATTQRGFGVVDQRRATQENTTHPSVFQKRDVISWVFCTAAAEEVFARSKPALWPAPAPYSLASTDLPRLMAMELGPSTKCEHVEQQL